MAQKISRKIGEGKQKKVLSLVLCVAMMLSVMVVGAGAAFSDQSKIKNTEAVDACTALNIIGGYPDGSFKPEGNITRAEVTKMICVALNGGKEPNLATNATPTFSDVRTNANSAWAEKYIESCASQGIVSGVGAGKFAPAGNVTGTQLAKMLLVSLGYKSENEGFTGNAWATNVNTIASAKGLYAGLEKMDVSAALTRDSAARMIWNALQAYEVEYKTSLIAGPDGKLSTQITVQDKVVGSTNDKITLLADKYDAWISVGTLVSVDGKTLKLDMDAEDIVVSDYYKTILDTDGKTIVGYYSQFTKLDKDYSALIGQKVKVVFKNGKTNDVIGVYATGDNNSYTVNASDVENDKGDIKFNDKTYKVELNDSKQLKTYVDGKEVTGKTVDDLVAMNKTANVLTLIDTDDNDKIDTVYVKTIALEKVTYVSSKEIIAGNTSYKYEDNNIAKDIAKDDYVAISANLYDDCKDVVKATKVSSTVSGYKDCDNSNSVTAGDKYMIDGTWYYVTDNAKMNSIQVGNKVDAWVYNGVIAYAKRTAGESGTVGDVCVISAIGSNIEGKKVKIVTFDGKESIVAYDDENHSSDGYVNPTQLKTGVAYEYEIVKDEYRFKQLNDTADWYGDYTATKINSSTGLANTDTVAADSNGKVEKVAGTKVDDSAKVILVTDKNSNGDIDTKVINGKQLKSMEVASTGAGKVNNSGSVAAFTSKVDGITRVTYAVVLVNDSIDSKFSTNDHYGYITDTAYLSSTGYVTYKVWTGEKEETVTEKKSNIDNRSEGTVIGYTAIENGEIKDVDALGVGARDGITAAAVQGVNDKQTKVSFDGTTQYDITSDTVILYVDTDKHEGQAGGSIVEADKFGNTYFNNVYYKLDGDDVELLVVDVKNMLNGEITMATPSAADLNTALQSGDVTVNTLPATGDVTVPAGKTLTVTGDNQTAAQLERVVGAAAGAKLVVENDTTDNATAGLFGSVSGTTFTPISSAVIDDGTYVWTNVAAAGATASYKWVK